jgi:uncharacterized membrane protein YbhN (UPF0104 family)
LIRKNLNRENTSFHLPTKIKLIIRWGLAVLCLGYVVVYLIKNREDLFSLRQIQSSDLIILFAISILGQLIYAFRMRIILEKNSRKNLPFCPWLKIFFISRFISLYAGQAGNVYRGVVLKKNHQVSYTNYISSYLFINWIDMVMGLCFGIIIISILKPQLKIYGINSLFLLTVLFALLIIIPLLVMFLMSKLEINSRFLRWIHTRFTEMLSTAIDGCKDLSYLIKIMVSGLVSLFNTIAMIYFCFNAIKVNISLDIAIFYKIITDIFNKIVITPSNIGVKEIVYGLLSKEFAIAMMDGILVSLIIRILGIIILTTIGIAIGGTNLFKTPKELKEKDFAS